MADFNNFWHARSRRNVA